MNLLKSTISFLFIILISGCGITGSTTKEIVLKETIAKEGPFNVTNIVDGDTLDVDTIGRIRLSGINTPETGECYYQEAKDKLAELALGKDVYLEKDKTDLDKYGRRLRYLYIDNLMVNKYLVENGFARVYDKYEQDTKRYDELKEIEKLALGIGVWVCKDKKEECLYVGSKNSDKYHKPDCKWAKRIKPENLVCYYSEEEVKDLTMGKGC